MAIETHLDPVWVAIEYVLLERDRLQEQDKTRHQACEFGIMNEDGEVLDNRCRNCKRMDRAWMWLKRRDDWQGLLQRAELILSAGETIQ